MTQQGSGPVQATPATGEGQSAGVRAAGSRPCPACGSPVNVNVSVCPTCGTSLPSRNKKIRCRHCHGTASASLVICPHCGRELQPAPPRLLTWGVPVLLVLLFGTVFLARLGGANPVTWTQDRVARAAGFVSSLGDRLQPEITVETLPVEEAIEDQLVSAPAPTAANADADQAQPPAEAVQPAATPQEAAAAPPTAAATATAEPTATIAPTSTTAPTATAVPELPTATATVTSVPPTATPLSATATATLALRATASPTATVRSTVLAAAASPTVTGTAITSQSIAAALLVLPTPTPTVAVPTPTPQLYTVRVGDTLFELALANDISLDLLLAANGLTGDDVYTIQPGDTLIIPDPNATPAATATPEPTATSTPVAGSTYTVRAGDTLMAIALRNGITTQALLDANGLTLAEARTLRPGQELIIPGSGNQPITTPTTAPTTAAAPPSSGVTAEVRLDTPVLRTPENGTVVSCGKAEALVWNAVPFIQASDLYLVHLGYVNNAPAGSSEEVVWVLEQQRPSATTSWELDDSLCGLAPFEFGRQWRWYVEVVERAADGKLNPVSAPSPVWGFSWQ